MRMKKIFMIFLLGIVVYVLLSRFYQKFYNGPPILIKYRETVADYYSQIAPDHWEKVLKENYPCYRKGLKEPSSFIQGKRCWKQVADQNRIDTETALCLFQPLTGRSYKRHDKNKTVVLSISVHIGHAQSVSWGAPCSNIEVVNWEPRLGLKALREFLPVPYTKIHLEKTQKAFWERYKDDPDLKRADIISCGFDVWHCLIFSPFNKKMIINSAYRFDGHLPTSKEEAILQQNILYSALRYNPDVILAGEIVYDVMYTQHFLGTHKMIPLPATTDYVIGKLRNEIKNGKCPGVPPESNGYHPKTPIIISISPKRLSQGGRLVANEMKSYFQKKPLPNNYKVDIMERDMKQPFNYCDLGKYSAHIVLGYSVMSFFTSECVNLGIPLFVPSPRLYAEFEKKFHLILERKNTLAQMSYSHMTENVRSLNKGFNPNDDFDLTALEKWVSYSDYFYYKGATTFDSVDDLYDKLKNASFTESHRKQLQHTVQNAIRNRANWEAVDRYFHGHENDVISSATPVRAENIVKGMEIWNKVLTRPNLKGTTVEVSKPNAWVLINLHNYKKDFPDFSDCQPVPGFTFLFYVESGESKVDEKSGCHVMSIQKMNENLPDIFKAKQPKWQATHFQLIASVYAAQNGATKIITLMKSNSKTLCDVDTNLQKVIRGSASWKQQEFEPRQFWLAWIPAPIEIASLYTKTLLKFTDYKPPSDCVDSASLSYSFSQEEIEILKDYLEHWNTDEREDFFHVVDQLNFELAVKGYSWKSDAILHRLWMQFLATLKFQTSPTLKI